MTEDFKLMNNSLDITSCYDPFYKEVICKHGNEVVWIFNEDTNRWESKRDYQYCDIISEGYAFKGLEAHALEQNPLYNTFFGAKYDSEVEPFVSEPGTESKVMQTVDVDSKHAWFPLKVNSESGLNTDGRLDKMVQKEWLWSCPIGFMAGTEKKMRSRSFSVLLRLNPSITSETELYDLFINYSHSEPQTAK